MGHIIVLRERLNERRLRKMSQVTGNQFSFMS